MSFAAGSRLGVYEVIAPIGAGGMGEVYRARDPKLRRDVALKVLPAAFASDPDRLARFEREAYAVAALSHPNILAIHDFGRDSGISYAVMELLEGQTLREALANGALPRRKALDYGRQIAQALAAAHARGIVHRDLKPENVFITTGGHVKVLDFGLASTAAMSRDGDATQAITVTGTQAGTVLGTPGYMSPEQVRGETVDHRSDIFSFGCVLYEMVSGLRAFAGESSIDTLHATLRAEPRDLASLSDVPVALTRVVERCLEKNPVERMQSTRDLVFTLDTITAGDAGGGSAVSRSPSSDVPVAAAAPVEGAMRSYVVRRALMAIALIAALAGGWIAVRGRLTTPAPSASAPRGLAVLPFENLAGPDQAYFAAGVTEEVTLQIAKMSALPVMSRAAVARFKDPLSELAVMTRELGIGAVLTGSVRDSVTRTGSIRPTLPARDARSSICRPAIAPRPSRSSTRR